MRNFLLVLFCLLGISTQGEASRTRSLEDNMDLRSDHNRHLVHKSLRDVLGHVTSGNFNQAADADSFVNMLESLERISRLYGIHFVPTIDFKENTYEKQCVFYISGLNVPLMRRDEDDACYSLFPIKSSNKTECKEMRPKDKNLSIMRIYNDEMDFHFLMSPETKNKYAAFHEKFFLVRKSDDA